MCEWIFARPIGVLIFSRILSLVFQHNIEATAGDISTTVVAQLNVVPAGQFLPPVSTEYYNFIGPPLMSHSHDRIMSHLFTMK